MFNSSFKALLHFWISSSVSKSTEYVVLCLIFSQNSLKSGDSRTCLLTLTLRFLFASLIGTLFVCFVATPTISSLIFSYLSGTDTFL